MTIGERIKEIRQQRGLTQKQLAQKVNLSDVRIRQYEINNRTPKYDTLKAIANALHVSINVFDTPELETLGDIKALLFQLDNKVGITFDGEKDEDGKYINGTVTLSFDNPQIAKFLKEWADAKSFFSDYKNAVRQHTEIEQAPILEHIESQETSYENANYTTYDCSIIVSKSNSSNLRTKISTQND